MYVATDNSLFAIHASNGTTIWEKSYSSGGFSVGLSQDGDTVYIGLEDNTVSAVNVTTQNEIWRSQDLGFRVEALSSNKQTLFAGAGNSLYGLDPDNGDYLWGETNYGNSIEVIEPRNDAYIGSIAGDLKRVNSTGGVEWHDTYSDGVSGIGVSSDNSSLIVSTQGVWNKTITTPMAA